MMPFYLNHLRALWSNLMTAYSWAVYVEVLFKLMYEKG